MYPNQSYTPAPGQPDGSVGQPAPMPAVSNPPIGSAAMPLPPQSVQPLEQGAAADPNVAWLPPTVPVQPSSPSGQPDGSQQAAQNSGSAVPNIADDGDLIEKEWVNGVKEIIMRTRQDPYMQTKELHKYKAEYMKKRYNKIIEAVEE